MVFKYDALLLGSGLYYCSKSSGKNTVALIRSIIEKPVFKNCRVYFKNSRAFRSDFFTQFPFWSSRRMAFILLLLYLSVAMVVISEKNFVQLQAA